MTVSAERDLHYDPYDVDLSADSYPMFRRLREEAPLYYNETHDFYALSRFEDVDNGRRQRHLAHLDFGSGVAPARGTLGTLVHNRTMRRFGSEP